LLRALPANAPLPTGLHEAFSYSNLVRIRRGQRQRPILATNTTLFSFRKNGRRPRSRSVSASAFFRQGQFNADTLEVRDGRYILRQNSTRPYYQAAQQRADRPRGNTKMAPPNGTPPTAARAARARSNIQTLESVVEITEIARQVHPAFSIAGTARRARRPRTRFRHGGKTQPGVEPVPHIDNAFLLRRARVATTMGDASSSRPRPSEHTYTRSRRPSPKWDGLSVYLTRQYSFKASLNDLLNETPAVAALTPVSVHRGCRRRRSARPALREYDILRAFPARPPRRPQCRRRARRQGLHTGSNHRPRFVGRVRPSAWKLPRVIAAVVAGDLAPPDNAWRGIDSPSNTSAPTVLRIQAAGQRKISSPSIPTSRRLIFFSRTRPRRARDRRVTACRALQGPHHRPQAQGPPCRRYINSGYDTIIPKVGHSVNRAACGDFVDHEQCAAEFLEKKISRLDVGIEGRGNFSVGLRLGFEPPSARWCSKATSMPRQALSAAARSPATTAADHGAATSR